MTLKPLSARPEQPLIGNVPTVEPVAVVLHDSVPVTFPASLAGEYESAGSFGWIPVRFGVVPTVLVVWTVTVSSVVTMMLPLLAVPIRHRVEVHAAALTAVIPVGPALSAVTGPLIGFPCCVHVEPSTVSTTVPIAPPAKQVESLTHATAVSGCALPLVCGVHVEPPSVDFSSTALPPTTAPAA